ncbi:MAG: RluA family pseudouridine synthase [Prevotellaceae bacterium]|jgi:23S rRNA pseudouridine1911/1915/1917 synthase|nr:RluA family pseudouridine synthase [Prevotellaceae bacterium]
MPNESAASVLYEHYHFTVDRRQSAIRIDKYLVVHIAGISRNRIQAAADANYIIVNNKPVKSSYQVKSNDEIRIVMPFERRGVEVLPEDIPLTILYEDDTLLVVDKPPNMVVHPGHGNYSGTLLNGLVYHGQMKHEKAFLVHRIDKDTSGALVVAKTEEALMFLSNQFSAHTSKRLYMALVWGNVQQDEGTITANIGRDPNDRLRFKVFHDENVGRYAITHYRVLERFGYVTLIECRLETGRTHQIRVHMSHIGHPLFNDERYGGDAIRKGTVFSKYKQFITNCFEIMPRQALHARLLGFVHPTTNEEMMFESPLPDDFSRMLEKWRNYKPSVDEKIIGMTEN